MQKTKTSEKLFILSAALFLIVSAIFSAFTITGYTVLQDEQKTAWLGLVFFLAGIASIILARLDNLGIK